MKKFSRILALVLSVMLVFANTAKINAFDYAKVNGGTTKLYKYLVVDKDVTSPKVTFNFSIAAGSSATASGEGGTDAATLPVYAGLTPNLVKIGDAANDADGKVAFAMGDAATAGATNDGITGTADKKYGTKDIFVDFSGVEFDKPGVYRYILTEATSNDENLGGVDYDVNGDNDKNRTIDVYVEDNNGTLRVTGYVSYLGTVTDAPKQQYNSNGYTGPYANGDPAGTGIDVKSNKYINEVKMNQLTLEKEITGNQGDRESIWAIKVKFETLPTDYKVQYAKISAEGADVDNPAYQDYTNEAEITFNHKDKYQFKGIPEGVKYTVTEVRENQDGYKTTYTEKEYTYPSDTEVETKVAKVENNRQGVVPTGVITAVIPGAILVGAAALYFLTKKEEEDE